MRDIHYQELAAITGANSGRSKSKKQGTLADLVFDLRRQWQLGLNGAAFPSLPALQALLLCGRVDWGMGGGYQWPPLELSVDEYEEIRLELLTRPG